MKILDMKNVLFLSFFILFLVVLKSDARVREYQYLFSATAKRTTGHESQDFLDVEAQQQASTRESYERAIQVQSQTNSTSSRRRSILQMKDPEHDFNELTNPPVTRKERMRLAMQRMFGFGQRTSPTQTAAAYTTQMGLDHEAARITNENIRPGVHNSSAMTPPDFLLDLQKVYNEDKNFMLTQSKIKGDTIRSFFPISIGKFYFKIEKKKSRLTYKHALRKFLTVVLFSSARFL